MHAVGKTICDSVCSNRTTSACSRAECGVMNSSVNMIYNIYEKYCAKVRWLLIIHTTLKWLTDYGNKNEKNNFYTSCIHVANPAAEKHQNGGVSLIHINNP